MDSSFSLPTVEFPVDCRLQSCNYGSDFAPNFSSGHYLHQNSKACNFKRFQHVDSTVILSNREKWIPYEHKANSNSNQLATDVQCQLQSLYYRRKFCDSYIPSELLTSLLKESIDTVKSLQSIFPSDYSPVNLILHDSHMGALHPSGPLLSKVFYTSFRTKKHGANLSNREESSPKTSAFIFQKSSSRHLFDMNMAVRNITWTENSSLPETFSISSNYEACIFQSSFLSLSKRFSEDFEPPKSQILHPSDRFTFASLLTSCSMNPYIRNEFIFATQEGELFTWLDGHLKLEKRIHHEPLCPNHSFVCRYLSHPRVVLLGGRKSLHLVDFRVEACPSDRPFVGLDSISHFDEESLHCMDIPPGAHYDFLISTTNALALFDIRKSDAPYFSVLHSQKEPPKSISTISIADFPKKLIITSGGNHVVAYEYQSLHLETSTHAPHLASYPLDYLPGGRAIYPATLEGMGEMILERTITPIFSHPSFSIASHVASSFPGLETFYPCFGLLCMLESGDLTLERYEIQPTESSSMVCSDENPTLIKEIHKSKFCSNIGETDFSIFYSSLLEKSDDLDEIPYKCSYFPPCDPLLTPLQGLVSKSCKTVAEIKNLLAGKNVDNILGPFISSNEFIDLKFPKTLLDGPFFQNSIPNFKHPDFSAHCKIASQSIHFDFMPPPIQPPTHPIPTEDIPDTEVGLFLLSQWMPASHGPSDSEPANVSSRSEENPSSKLSSFDGDASPTFVAENPTHLKSLSVKTEAPIPLSPFRDRSILRSKPKSSAKKPRVQGF